MRFGLKHKVKNTNWVKVFAWKPVKTEDNVLVWLEYVETRYKIHMSGGSYVYQVINKDD